MVRVRMLAAAIAATLVPSLVLAQASAPKTRDEFKAETRAAQQAGELTPAGGGTAPAPKSTKHSTTTKEKRKAETLEARKKGELVPAGGGSPAPAK